jgi:hypothetical protein
MWLGQCAFPFDLPLDRHSGDRVSKASLYDLGARQKRPAVDDRGVLAWANAARERARRNSGAGPPAAIRTPQRLAPRHLTIPQRPSRADQATAPSGASPFWAAVTSSPKAARLNPPLGGWVEDGARPSFRGTSPGARAVRPFQVCSMQTEIERPHYMTLPRWRGSRHRCDDKPKHKKRIQK